VQRYRERRNRRCPNDTKQALFLSFIDALTVLHLQVLHALQHQLPWNDKDSTIIGALGGNISEFNAADGRGY
jgi:hypothetical protein